LWPMGRKRNRGVPAGGGGANEVSRILRLVLRDGPLRTSSAGHSPPPPLVRRQLSRDRLADRVVLRSEGLRGAVVPPEQLHMIFLDAGHLLELGPQVGHEVGLRPEPQVPVCLPFAEPAETGIQFRCRLIPRLQMAVGDELRHHRALRADGDGLETVRRALDHSIPRSRTAATMCRAVAAATTDSASGSTPASYWNRFRARRIRSNWFTASPSSASDRSIPMNLISAA